MGAYMYHPSDVAMTRFLFLLKPVGMVPMMFRAIVGDAEDISSVSFGRTCD